MKLRRLACNGCGADIELPDDARFVTCRYCDAQLEVTETEGAAFTRVREVVERVAAKTEKLGDEVAVLRAEQRVLALQRELDDLARAWEERRASLMTRYKNGELVAPTRTQAFGFGAGAGVFCLVVAGVAPNSPAPWLGLAVLAAGIVGAVVTLQKTARYEAALAEYLDEKAQLEARLAKAERRARARRAKS